MQLLLSAHSLSQRQRRPMQPLHWLRHHTWYTDETIDFHQVVFSFFLRCVSMPLNSVFVMLFQAFASVLCMLVELGYAQSFPRIPANHTQEHTTSGTLLVTASIRSPPLITGAPLQLNGPGSIGSGMVLYDNATFATSCAYNDSDCASRCSWHHDACSRTSADWWRTGVMKTMNKDLWTTDTQTVHNFTQSLTVTKGYTYAIGPEITTWTTTETVSWWDPQLQVVSTLVPSPPCNTPTFSCTKQPWCNKDACTVQGGSVELLFWPSTSAIANHTGDHIKSTASGPVTAVYKNTTLTSPSVYLEYKTAYALNGCSQTVGGHYPGAILALDPNDLFSIDARLDYFVMTTTIKDELHTTSFYNKVRVNYNDLTGLPPASAYMAMPMCFASGCAIITPSLFHPQLVVPTQIREMDPAWATCDMDWRGSWDPPIALSEAETIAVPTMPTDPTHSPPVSSRPILDGPAKPTTPPEASTKPSLTMISTRPAESGYQSLGDPNKPPAFTYDPLSPSTGDHKQPSSNLNDVPVSASTTMSFVQVTTIVQITQSPIASQNPIPSAISTSDRGSAYDPDGDSPWDGGSATRIPEAPSQQVPTNEVFGGPRESIAISSLPDIPHHTTVIAGQTIVLNPDGGLQFSNTVISAGDEPITISSMIYSADPAGALVIISNSAADQSTHSPTNAYEVLSEALSIATAYHPSTSNEASDITTHPSFSLNDPASTLAPTHTLPPEGGAALVLTLDSTNLAATYHPSSNGVIQLGDSSQFLNSQKPVLTIGSYTLSVAPDGEGIVVDGSTTATFSHRQTSATVPISSSSDLPSVQDSGISATETVNGNEEGASGAPLPPVTFASSARPGNENTGGGGGEVGSGSVNSGSDESGASLPPKMIGSWLRVGMIILILLANG